MKWNTKALVADCDLRQLAQYLGIKTKRYGATTFIECLSGMHSETQINHCEAKRNGCRCYSCHASYENGSTSSDNDWNDTIAVVRQYRRMYGGDSSFNAACETIAEYLGNKERYLLKGESNLKKAFPYSKEELIAAGLSDDSTARKVMHDLFERDEKFFNSILLNKLEENMNKLNMIVSVSTNGEISEVASERLKDASNLYEKMTGKKMEGRLFR